MQFEIPDYAHVHIVVGPPASAEGSAQFEPGPVDALVALPGQLGSPRPARHLGRLLLKSSLAVVLLVFSFAVGQHFGGATSLHAINTASGLARDVAPPQTAGQVHATAAAAADGDPAAWPDGGAGRTGCGVGCIRCGTHTRQEPVRAGELSGADRAPDRRAAGAAVRAQRRAEPARHPAAETSRNFCAQLHRNYTRRNLSPFVLGSRFTVQHPLFSRGQTGVLVGILSRKEPSLGSGSGAVGSDCARRHHERLRLIFRAKRAATSALARARQGRRPL
jgi:hypothetical protein